MISCLLLWLIHVLFRCFLHRPWCCRPLFQTTSTTATSRCSYTLASSASHINTTQQTQAESCSRSETSRQLALRHIHFAMLNAAEKGAQNTPLFKCCRAAHQGCRTSWIFQVLPGDSSLWYLTAAQWLSTVTAYKFLYCGAPFKASLWKRWSRNVLAVVSKEFPKYLDSTPLS